MQISLRSPLIAGTAAAVGAAAVAITPMTPAVPVLPTSATQVALAGFDNPVTELIGTVGLLGTTLFSGAAAPAPLPENVVGLVPDIISQQLPIISQLGLNGSDYLDFTFTALTLAATTLSEAVWNLPEALIDAGGQLIGGQITDALATLIEATFVPIQDAASAVLGAGVYVFDGVLRRASAVAALIPGLVGGLAQNLLDNVNVLVASVGAIVEGVSDGITSGDLDVAWNAVVDGLLGPTGIPGAVINATIGLGNGAGADFVPSLRTAVTGGVQAVAQALATPVLPTQPTQTAAVRSSAARVAAPAAAEAPTAALSSSDVRDSASVPVLPAEPPTTASPAAGTETAGDSGAAAASDAPAKQRVSRKAAASD